MFDRIVLRAVGRIVGDAQFDLQVVRQSLQVFLEQVVCGAVASAAIAQDQQARRGGVSRAAVLLPPLGEAVAAEFAGVVAGVQVDVGVPARQIVDAVRNQFAVSPRWENRGRMFRRSARCRSGRRGESSPARRPSRPSKKQRLLFRVDAEDRLARVLELAPQPGDVLELSVAIRMVSPRDLLPCRAASDLELSQQTTDHAATGRSSRVDQPALQFSQRQVRPPHADAHRIARREFRQPWPQIRLPRRSRLDQPSSATPFFRTRPTAGSSGSSNSFLPWRIVLGSHPGPARTLGRDGRMGGEREGDSVCNIAFRVGRVISECREAVL